MTIQNQRPGVYSRYDVASSYMAPLSLKYAAVVAKSTGGEASTLYSFSNFSEAGEVFSPDEQDVFMHSLISLLFESGVSKVLAVPVGDDYETALAALETAENIGAVICDASTVEDLTALKAHIIASYSAQRECIGFCGANDPAFAISAAKMLNYDRIVITCPCVSAKKDGPRFAIFAAAALAGKILASGDAAANLNGEAFPLLTQPEALAEPVIQSLLEAGVTVFESVGGNVECIRALTTRTMADGVPDRSMTGINSPLIIDDVLQFIRSVLKSHLRGGRINGSPIESIRSQVTIALASKQSDGLIESFEVPRCYPSPSDPSICVVEMNFTIAHVISQIHVTSHIQI